ARGDPGDAPVDPRGRRRPPRPLPVRRHAPLDRSRALRRRGRRRRRVRAHRTAPLGRGPRRRGARPGRVLLRGLSPPRSAGAVGLSAPGPRPHNASIEHQKAGAVIGSSEERYRDLVENSNELIWSADSFGRWTFVNDAARRIYGCAPEEMIGRPMTDWMVPGEAAPDLPALERVLEGERYVQHETRHRRKDGTLVTLSFKTTAVRDPRGNLLGTTRIASDVTGLRGVQA